MVKIFIGCANESMSIAQTIQLGFSKQPNRPLCIIWNQGVFKPQEYVIPALIKQISECDYLRKIYLALNGNPRAVDIQKLSEMGYTTREIEILTRIPKSSVSRKLKETK